jgi:hypothetical protein
LVTNSLATLAPEVAAQWHLSKIGDIMPADVVSRSGTKYWWRRDTGPDHEWEARPTDRVGQGTGCPCCSRHKLSVINSLATLAPEVAAEWHPTKNGDTMPSDVVSQTHKKYWWRCDIGLDHEWQANPSMRVGSGSGCPCCSGGKVSVTNSLATLAPEVAAQWHPTKNGDAMPEDVVSQTNKKYWWLCDAGPGHTWMENPNMRVGNSSGAPAVRTAAVESFRSPTIRIRNRSSTGT